MLLVSQKRVATYALVATAFVSFQIAQAGASLSKFKVPHSRYTEPMAINALGDVTGWHSTHDGDQAFLRTAAGDITEFKVASSKLTMGLSINASDAIVGTYYDQNYNLHSFLRNPDGTMNKIELSVSTTASGISDNGVIAGAYWDTNNNEHGFLLSSRGKVTSFDAPGAAGATIASALNKSGAVAGHFFDTDEVAHGFVRSRDGVIEEFDAPDAGTGAGQGTYPLSINRYGSVAGYYTDANDHWRGLLRDAEGNITEFDDPLSTDCTVAASINSKGAVAGFYNCNGSEISHSFVRLADGSFRELQENGKVNQASGINDYGLVTGHIGNSRTEGFLWRKKAKLERRVRQGSHHLKDSEK